MSYQPVASSEDGPGAPQHRWPARSFEPVQKGPDRTQSWPSFICCWILTVLVFLLVVITFPITGWFVVKSVPHYERFVVFRLGRIIGSKGPGRILLLPFIDQWRKVDIRTKTFNVAPFKAACKDGALILISAEVHYHIWNPVLSVAVVQDVNSTAMLTVQNVMMNFLRKKKLAKVQLDKSKTRDQLVFEINEKTKYWGLEVERVGLTLHKVLQVPEVILQSYENLPPSSRLDRLPVPLRKLAVQILQNRSSTPAPRSAQPSVHSSRSEENEESGSEEIESDSINPDWVLSKVRMLLSEDLVKQIGACYLFNVNQKNGNQNLYHLDLTRDSGKAGYGMPNVDPDVSLEVTEDTMQALFSGDLKPLSAYMSGRIRIQGDLKLAMKLEDLIKKLQNQ